MSTLCLDGVWKIGIVVILIVHIIMFGSVSLAILAVLYEYRKSIKAEKTGNDKICDYEDDKS